MLMRQQVREDISWNDAVTVSETRGARRDHKIRQRNTVTWGTTGPELRNLCCPTS